MIGTSRFVSFEDTSTPSSSMSSLKRPFSSMCLVELGGEQDNNELLNKRYSYHKAIPHSQLDESWDQFIDIVPIEDDVDSNTLADNFNLTSTSAKISPFQSQKIRKSSRNLLEFTHFELDDNPPVETSKSCDEAYSTTPLDRAIKRLRIE